jgi:hypothetical protein
MTYQKVSRYAVTVFAALFFLPGIHCSGQEGSRDHTCTVDASGSFAVAKGQDGHNFESGWGIRTGGGFAFTPIPKRRGFSGYLTANYMYEQLGATTGALNNAKMLNPTQLATATSARGSFSAVTIDPTVRFAMNRRLGFYGSGGFGWFRRGVVFHGANPATLIQSSSASLDRLASNSGAFDLGGGANVGLTRNGGLMVFTEIRLYVGAAINSGTKLLPLSVGVRW